MTEPLISACMIVRDEAHNLPACFSAAAGVVDEWIVLDTGSTDDTVAVARDLGATVLQDPWRDDFSYSRNLSLEPATGRWILILDGDDRLDEPAAFRAFMEGGPPEDAFCMLVQSPLDSDEPGARWESPAADPVRQRFITSCFVAIFLRATLLLESGLRPILDGTASLPPGIQPAEVIGHGQV